MNNQTQQIEYLSELFNKKIKSAQEIMVIAKKIIKPENYLTLLDKLIEINQNNRNEITNKLNKTNL